MSDDLPSLEDIATIQGGAEAKKKKRTLSLLTAIRLGKTSSGRNMKSVRSFFNDFVKGVTSCEDWKTDRSFRMYRMLPKFAQRKLLTRLEQLDPVEYLKVLICHQRNWRAVNERTRWKVNPKNPNSPKFFVRFDKQEIQKAVKEKIDEQPGMDKIQKVSIEGLKQVATVCLASGMQRQEVADLFKLSLDNLNSLVEDVSVDTQHAIQQKAIISLSNVRVLKDLSSGVVTEDTERADRIASRRIKLNIDAHAEGRETVKQNKELTDEREKGVARRFGVDRSTGIETASKEIK